MEDTTDVTPRAVLGGYHRGRAGRIIMRVRVRGRMLVSDPGIIEGRMDWED